MSQYINLYAPHLRPSRAVITGLRLSWVLFVLLAALIPLGSWLQMDADKLTHQASTLRQEITAKETVLAEKTKQMAERGVSPVLAASLAEARGMLALTGEVLARLKSGEIGNMDGFSPLFVGLAKQAPGNLWLTQLDLKQGGNNVDLKGKMLQSENLPPYIERLGKENSFLGRSFETLEMKEVALSPARTQAVAGQAPVTQAASYVEFHLRSVKSGGKP